MTQKVQKNVSYWWNNSTLPCLKKVGTSVQQGFAAQIQADIMNGEMRLYAWNNFITWTLSSVDNTLHVLSGVSAFGGVAALGLEMPVLGGVMTAAGVIIYIIQCVRMADEE